MTGPPWPGDPAAVRARISAPGAMAARRPSQVRAGTGIRGRAPRPGSEMGAAKSMTKVPLVLVLSCAFLSASGGSAQERDSIREGQGLFEKHCSVCHGASATGQSTEDPAGGWDKDLNRLAPALDGTGHAWHHPPSLLFRYIREGSIDRTSPMPSFGDRLDEREIRSIIAYIQSLWPDALLLQYKRRFQDEMP